MAKASKILLVDDDELFLRVLSRRLRGKKYQVSVCTDPRQTVRMAIESSVNLVLLDIRMPDLDGFEVLRQLKTEVAGIEVVMMTGFANTEAVIQAMRLGATDFLVKPFASLEEVCAVIQRVLKLSASGNTRQDTDRNGLGKNTLLFGSSPAMDQVKQMLSKVARSDAPILITGESGTGKDLIAREIHRLSRRCMRPWIPVNCAALPENLQESELFGYTRGAFTGAVADKRGLFFAAEGGSLFLDEIGDLALATQTKLLRVLQVRRVRPIGANSELPVDFRLICATNVDLGQMVAEQRFRGDLCYRINVLRIEVPPLRERPEDIPELAEFFLEQYSAAEGKEGLALTKEALRALLARRWRGNVRELQNTLHRAVLLAEGPWVTAEHLGGEDADSSPGGDSLSTRALLELPFTEAKRALTESFEKQYLQHALDRADGKIAAAARLARIDRTNFKRLARRHQVSAALDKNRKPT